MRNRQPVVVLPGGGTREIERRGVHIAVNVARGRSKTRSKSPRGRYVEEMTRLAPVVINSLRGQPHTRRAMRRTHS